ncbi:MAG: class F sortase [Dehalococcoidia bacterium]|nr:class F sortase [Dehalococcoidia bacterium]
MGSSVARRAQLLLLLAIGIAALTATVLIVAGNTGGAGGLRLFGVSMGGQTRQTGAAAGAGGARRPADSVEAFTRKYGDPPDATYGRIRIPSISVNAPLSYRAVSGSVMPEPGGATDVAYYDMSRFPGTGGVPGGGGNAIFGGHVDLRRPIPYAGDVEYQGPGVFWSLDKLRPGDIIEVDYRGSTYRYRVSAVNEFSADKADWGKVWSSDVKNDTITLFTCGGTFNPETHEYSTRLIVRAERG